MFPNQHTAKTQLTKNQGPSYFKDKQTYVLHIMVTYSKKGKTRSQTLQIIELIN